MRASRSFSTTERRMCRASPSSARATGDAYVWSLDWRRRSQILAVPDQLAVVRVQTGENLQHLAARVAPDAPLARVVARIRELNNLDSAALDAGQTLIAPVGPGADHAR